MKQAEKFKRPIICFVDTIGAACGRDAEERGQGSVIAELLRDVSIIEDRWMKQMQLEYLEDALQYKRQIKQSRGLSRLLKMKKDILGKLDREEEILLGMETLMG